MTRRICINLECGWEGDDSETMTMKHGQPENLCPQCHEITEDASDMAKVPVKLYEYKWIDEPKPCRVCGGSRLYAGATCGKCNGHGEYYVARLARRRLGTEQWIPVHKEQP